MPRLLSLYLLLYTGRQGPFCANPGKMVEKSNALKQRALTRMFVMTEPPARSILALLKSSPLTTTPFQGEAPPSHSRHKIARQYRRNILF